jgi:hypothetical protein
MNDSAGKGPSKPAPRFVGEILAFLLNLVSAWSCADCWKGGNKG